MPKKNPKILEGIIGLFLIVGFWASLGTAIALGVTNKSFWSAALSFLAIIMLFIAIGALNEKSISHSQIAFGIFAMTGLIVFILANQIVNFEGGWLWMPLWFTIGLSILIGAKALWNNQTFATSIFFFVIGALVLVISVLGPITSFDYAKQHLVHQESERDKVAELQTDKIDEEPKAPPTSTSEPPTPTLEEIVTQTQQVAKAEDPSDSPGAITSSESTRVATVSVASFFLNAFSTIWGLLYILILALVGLFLSRKWWGSLVSLAAVFCALLLWQILDPDRLLGLTKIFTLNPISFWRVLIFQGDLQSIGLTGTLLLIGFSLSIIFGAFQWPQKSAKNIYGNILLGLALLAAVGSLWIALNPPPASIIHGSGIKVMATPGYKNLSNWLYYLIAGGLLFSVVSLKSMQDRYSSTLFSFLHDTPSQITAISVIFIAVVIPLGVLTFMVGALLGTCLREFSIKKGAG